MGKSINVLWTGGLDSTYLLFRLSKYPVDIYPYYVIDPHRYSTQKELQAMEKIMAEIERRKDTEATIHQVKIVGSDSIKPYVDIADAWKDLNEKYALGSQYKFLANFARQNDLNLAVGVLFGERSKVEQCMKDSARLKESESFPDLFLQIADDHKDSAAYTVFEHLYFPKFMRNLEKTSEWSYFQDDDAGNIARMTWFCHRPVLGMTCGHCNPCKDALNEGMAFRVSKVGYVLGFLRQFSDKLLSLWHKNTRKTH